MSFWKIVEYWNFLESTWLAEKQFQDISIFFCKQSAKFFSRSKKFRLSTFLKFGEKLAFCDWLEKFWSAKNLNASKKSQSTFKGRTNWCWHIVIQNVTLQTEYVCKRVTIFNNKFMIYFLRGSHWLDENECTQTQSPKSLSKILSKLFWIFRA